MKIECIVEKLKEVIPLVDRVTGKNLTLPILNSILIIASGKTLKLRATNLDIGVEIEIPSKIESEGVALVNGSLLNSIISTITTKSLKIEKIGNNLHLMTPNNSIIIKTYPQEDFPTIPIISGVEFVFEVKKVIQAIKATAYSAPFSDIKPEISSVYIYEQNNELFFVATDSFRLAEKRIKIKKTKDFPEIIVPVKNIMEIVRIFDGVDGDINISVNKNQISFSHQNIYVTSRLVNGAFPDYRQIIPKEYKTKAIVLKQDLINSLKISAIFSGKFNELGITIKPKQKIFEINTKHQEFGENKTRIEGALSGEEIEANFNYKYIFECLQSIPDDSVSLLFNGVHKPLVLRGISDQSFLYLVMPMNR
ncbi:MAG: DNA polymerase III subunit beta [Candidatus Lloydbacteria bacterium RIFCSPHIGHO2_01_FULL_41_20]|uniref:Beta sliding clamp n=1 Tax=Candidatus Lloydbacteria bacterium RIFCSPHIGHO2_01_FULL_41_20 TaxID=1798657 RepID=A0A1G2CVW0_9BACT|nr:MAG: DNA polymerase III subunit beta [Candidatus Lloydbacteria bacterium RIFCSPHIGHO2_01_FULL_41_20]